MQKTITTNQKVTTNELKDDLTKLTFTALQDVKAPKTGFEYALIYENRTASKINYLSATTFNASSHSTSSKASPLRSNGLVKRSSESI